MVSDRKHAKLLIAVRDAKMRATHDATEAHKRSVWDAIRRAAHCGVDAKYIERAVNEGVVLAKLTPRKPHHKRKKRRR